MTDWNADQTRACQRGNGSSGVRLCNWLLDHASAEVMAANIVQALECAGMWRPKRGSDQHVDRIAGLVRAHPFAESKDVELILEFDSSPKDILPWLSISVKRWK
jgi:hypothetical protein